MHMEVICAAVKDHFAKLSKKGPAWFWKSRRWGMASGLAKRKWEETSMRVDCQLRPLYFLALKQRSTF
jgi:hypothetical protein